MNVEYDYGPYGAGEGATVATSYLLTKPFSCDLLNKKAQEAAGIYWSDDDCPFLKVAFKIATPVVEHSSITSKFVFGVTMNGSVHVPWSQEIPKETLYLQTLEMIPTILVGQNYDPNLGFTTMESINHLNNNDILATEAWTKEHDYVHRTIVEDDFYHGITKAVSKTITKSKEVARHSLEVLDARDIDEIWQECYASYGREELANIAKALTADLLTYPKYYGELYGKVFEDVDPAN